MLRVSVVGATGYSGVELVKILLNHPKVVIADLISKSYVGQKFADIYPTFRKDLDKVCKALDTADLARNSDLVFIALPTGPAQKIASELLAEEVQVIDLGADFRLEDVDDYRKWYGTEHMAEHLLDQAIYNIPEIHKKKLEDVQLVANPGCYPTSVLLGLAPIMDKQIVDTSSIIIDSKSGVSGAGRGLNIGVHFCQQSENFKAYKVASHRHIPEIEQELGKLCGEKVLVSFTPHLLPLKRGILSTIYLDLLEKVDLQELRDYYQDYYQDAPFVCLLPEGELPEIKNVAGSNDCHLNIFLDERVGRLVVVSVIDNLVKGAAGQAIQNMNILCGFEQTLGLNGLRAGV